MKNFFGQLAFAAVIATTLVSAAPKRGGKLVYGRNADSLFLDPVLNDANVDIWILLNIYDTLLQPTNDGKGTKPGLATKYKASADGKSFVLTLRSGVKFSDGSSLTAGDVKFSLDRARDERETATGVETTCRASVLQTPACDMGHARRQQD